MAAMAAKLSHDELKMMLSRCLKLASENKISASNTWEQPLLEHLEDLIRDQEEAEEAEGPNFQRASVTLDAGVKIYGYRVDSVHSETYKILGGLGRTDEGGPGAAEDGVDGAPRARGRRARARAAPDPSATLEASSEVLEWKEGDLASGLDPLFQHMAARLDAGGARGALLYQLRVERGCAVRFGEGGGDDDVAWERREVRGRAAAVFGAAVAAWRPAALAGRAAPLSPSIDVLRAAAGESSRVDAAARGVADLLAAAGARSEPEMAAGDDLPGAAGRGPGEAEDARGAGAGAGEAPDWLRDATGDTGSGEEDGAVDIGPLADGEGWEEGGQGDPDDEDDRGWGSAGESPARSAGEEVDALPFAKLSLDPLPAAALQWLRTGDEAAAASLAARGPRGWTGNASWRYARGPPRPDPVERDEAAEAAEPGASPAKRARGGAKKGGPLDFAALFAEVARTAAALPARPTGGAGELAPLLGLELAGAPGTKPLPRARRAGPLPRLPDDHGVRLELLLRLGTRPHAGYLGGRMRSGDRGAGVARGGSGSVEGGDPADDDGWDWGGDADGDEPSPGRGGGPAAAFGPLPHSWGGAALEPEEGGPSTAQGTLSDPTLAPIAPAAAAAAVDVRVLKRDLWRDLNRAGRGPTGRVNFKAALRLLAPDGLKGAIPAATSGLAETRSTQARPSVHLAFICLLHLCNEHSLSLEGSPTLNDLSISGLAAVEA